MRKEKEREVKEIAVYLDDNNRPYVREKGTGYYVEERKKHNSPAEVYEFARSIDLHLAAVEKVYMILFDSAFHIISECMISQGSVDRAIVSMREVCQTALLGGAVSVALIHNHPSSDVEPSDMDISLTEKVRKALMSVGIHLIEHLIVGRYDYFSMKENGMMREGEA